MRSPDQVVNAARARYWKVWRDELMTSQRQQFSFPLSPPSGATIVRSPADTAAWLRAWRDWLPQHPQVAARTRTVATRHGDQPVYTHLDVDGTAALASLDADTAAHYNQAQERWRHIAHPSPALRPWLSRIVALDDRDFDLLLAASAWLTDNPRSGLTVRRVPVPGMHTKWLARHRRLVRAMLGQSPVDAEPSPDLAEVLEAELDPSEIPVEDLDALGLRPLPVELDLVIVDAQQRATLGGLRALRAAVDEVSNLALFPTAVVIVENKESALAIEDIPGTVLIHSLGNNLGVLRNIAWLRPARVIYWGDLDRHGFTLLSRARALIPRLESVLMNPATIIAFRDRAVLEDMIRHDPPEPTLTACELAALTHLESSTVGLYLRIEQERLPTAVAQAAIVKALTDQPTPTHQLADVQKFTDTEEGSRLEL